VKNPETLKQDEIERLERLDRENVWHPFTQMREYMSVKPLLIERGEGAWLYDVRGNRFLDGVGSLWCNVHGHRHPHIDKAVREQLDKLAHSTLLGPSHPGAAEFAERLLEVAPTGMRRVFYSDSGATACEIALKIAFQHWQLRADRENKPELAKKTRFIRLQDAYHGDTIGAVSVGGIDLFHQIFHPLLFETIPFPSPVPAFNDAKEQVSKLVAEHAHETAAFIIEPLVQGAAGMRVHQEGFLKHLREVTREHDVLLICDEVATGFGRTGKMFAVEHEDVVPDLMALAKGITGGYLPLAATLTTEEVFEAFLGEHRDRRTFFHGHTYTGNPLACAAAIASLEVFSREWVLESLPEKMDQLAARAEALRDHPHVGDVRVRGMMGGIELVKDKAAGTSWDWTERMGDRVCSACRPKGVLLRPLGDVIVLMPPLCIDGEQIDLLFDAIGESIDEVCGRA
jgi:adenosylmethionine-8-amino-7-oxononanoate aminotransferase